MDVLGNVGSCLVQAALTPRIHPSRPITGSCKLSVLDGPIEWEWNSTKFILLEKKMYISLEKKNVTVIIAETGRHWHRPRHDDAQ